MIIIIINIIYITIIIINIIVILIIVISTYYFSILVLFFRSPIFSKQQSLHVWRLLSAGLSLARVLRELWFEKKIPYIFCSSH